MANAWATGTHMIYQQKLTVIGAFETTHQLVSLAFPSCSLLQLRSTSLLCGFMSPIVCGLLPKLRIPQLPLPPSAPSAVPPVNS
eukprot:scaffold53455_cov41-Cyclotella_meneghiniana.AAC.5